MISTRGLVTIGVHRASDMRLIRRVTVENLFVESGRSQLRDLVGYPNLPNISVPISGFTPNFIAIGSDGAATTSDMEELGAESFRKLVTRKVPGAGLITYYLFLASDEGNGTGDNEIRELGLFSVDTGGKLWARATQSLVTKNSGIALTIAWDLLFTAGA